MKKNISINISGIIFHIEEDGYEILRKYLDSINRYFSAFEDSSEILADIESRIAEILLSKLSEGKQVVTAEDVNSLMATMGSVNDFKAAEDQETETSEPKKEYKQSSQSSQSHADRRLFRDEKRKILGGVCAGLAHYFNIDPVWVRLLLALLAFASYGGLVVVYIIFWVVLPSSNTLEDESTAKKMYRDTEKKVLGGVAAGVSAYFGTDITLVRVLFIVFSFFGGLGVVIYIIMWIALPEAKTITEKIQMQGDPVTLSNIESSVKKGLNEKDSADESTLAKIVLFPFRLIAAIIDGLGKILGPVFMLIVDVLRIAIGVCITLTGVSLIVALVVAFGVALGLFHMPEGSVFNNWYVSAPNFPLEAMRQSFPTWTMVFAFLIGFIPSLMIALLGSSIIAKKIVFNSYVGWTVFVAFFISVAFLSVTIPQMVYAFKEEGEHKVEMSFPVKGMPYLKVNETGLDDYDVTDVTLRGYTGKEVKIIERFGAQGNTRKIAAENAQMVEYNVSQSDSVLLFDSNITFKKGVPFRAQRLDIEVFIPYNQPFVVEEAMWRLVDNRYDHEDYYPDRDETQTWKISEYGLLECVSCYKRAFHEEEDVVERSGNGSPLGLTGFNSIDLEGIFDVRIQQGEEFDVEISGPDSERRRYNIYVDGETLVIDYEDNRKFFWKRNLLDEHEIELTITMPSLHKLDAKGAGKLRFRGFKEDEVTIKLLGAVSGDGQLDSRNLTVNLTGASYLDLSGEGNFLDADITGASGLRAYSYEVKRAIVEAHGASTAKVTVTEKLEMEKGVASSISYRGDPDEIREN